MILVLALTLPVRCSATARVWLGGGAGAAVPGTAIVCGAESQGEPVRHGPSSAACAFPNCLKNLVVEAETPLELQRKSRDLYLGDSHLFVQGSDVLDNCLLHRKHLHWNSFKTNTNPLFSVVSRTSLPKARYCPCK